MNQSDEASKGSPGVSIAGTFPVLANRCRVELQGALWTVLGPEALIDTTDVTALDYDALRAFAQDAASRATRRLETFRFIELVPSLASLADQALPLGELSTRLGNRLREKDINVWAQIAPLTVGEVLAWHNTGANSVAELVGHAMVAGAEGPNGIAPLVSVADPDDRRTAQLVAAAREIAAYGAGLDPDSSWLALLSRLPHLPDLPIGVVEALDSLSSLTCGDVAGDASDAYDLDVLVGRIMERIPDREREIIRRRVLHTGTAPTLEDIGRDFEVTRERIRQLESKAIGRIEKSLEEDAFQPVLSAVEQLGAEVGVAAKLTALPDRLRSLAEQEVPDDGNATAHLLAWLAGPYLVSDGWLIRRDLADLRSIVRNQLRVQSRDGIVTLDDAAAVLDRLGFRGSSGAAWIDEDPKLRVLDDCVVMWEGGKIEKAELVLRLNGAAMSLDEIFEAIGEDASIRTLANTLGAEDRFLRRGKSRWGLAEWGGDEYTSTVDLIHDEIEDRGGQAAVDDIVDAITARFPDVLPATIRTFAASVQFVSVGSGVIRARTPSDPYVHQGQIELARDCFMIGGRWALRVRVNSEHLRGSGFAIPTAFAVSVGLRPSGRIEFTSTSGPVSLAWRVQPQMSSIRSLALDLGGEEDDLVFLRFLPSAQVEATIVRAKDIEAATPTERLLLQVGADQFSSDPLVAIGRSLGLASPEHASLAELEARLQKKGEEDLIPLLPTRAETVHAAAMLITGDESQTLEKKQTLSLNTHTGAKDKGVEHSVIKTVAAFLNTDGGVLFIGVHDVDSVVTGVEPDLELLGMDIDRYELHLRSLLTKDMGDATISTGVAIRFQPIDGKTVAEIRVDPSPNPVYIPDKGGTMTLFVRAGNQTKALAIDQAVRYIDRHFGGERFSREILEGAKVEQGTHSGEASTDADASPTGRENSGEG